LPIILAMTRRPDLSPEDSGSRPERRVLGRSFEGASGFSPNSGRFGDLDGSGVTPSTLSATNLQSQSTSTESHKRSVSNRSLLTLTRSGGRRRSFYQFGIVQRQIHGILRLFRHQSALTNQNSLRISVQLLQQSTNTRIREQ